MLHENLKRLRRSSGMSQEALAGKLHVVRQTVSKWERGASVPDAQLLKEIARLFGVSVSDLLEEAEGKNTDEMALQLALLNQRLDNRERRMETLLKCAAAVVGVLVLVWLVVNYGGALKTPVREMEKVVLVECTLDGQLHTYTIDCDAQGKVLSYGGDPWLHSQVQAGLHSGEEELNADALVEIIESFIRQRGGTLAVEQWDIDDWKRAGPSGRQSIYAEGK